MRIFKQLTLIVVLLLVAGASWAAIYAYDKGFTKKWRGLVNAEFEKRGIEASIGKLTLDPFQGLVARDVKFYQDEQRRKLLAAIDRVILDIDIIRLLEKDVFLNTIDIRKANLSLPVDPADSKSERLVIRNFNARILMPDDRIEISQAQGDLQGVRVAVHGRLFKPRPGNRDAAGAAPEEVSAERKAAESLEIIKERRHVLDLIVKELEKLEFPEDAPPVINLELAGDLDAPETLRGSARVTARKLKRGAYRCDELNARIELAHGRISVKEFHIVDPKGELRAETEYTWGADRIPLKLQSSIDAHALLTSFVDSPSLGEIVFYDAPKFQLEGEILLEPTCGLPIEAIGSFRCNTFVSRGEVFDGFEVDFSIDRDRFYYRNVRLSYKTGSLTAEVIYDATGLNYEADLRLNPSKLAAFTKNSDTAQFLQKLKLDLGEDSIIYYRTKGAGPSYESRHWHSFAEIDVRDFKFNDVPIERFEADAEFNKRNHYYTDVRMKLGGGSAVAKRVTHDLDTKISTIEAFAGNVDPSLATRCFNTAIADHLEKYRFSKPPAIKLSGTIDPRNRSATDLVVEFETDARVDYDFLGRKVPFENAKATLRFVGDNLEEAHIEAGLFGGTLVTDFAIVGLSQDRNYTAKVDFKSLRFHDLAPLYGYQQDTGGELTGYFNFTGKGDERDSIDGQGVAIIVNGDVFAIPVLGPLSKLIGGALPNTGAGYSIAREASANITMKNGVLATDDFEALATGFRIRGEGTVDLNRDRIDFDARLNARGAPGILLLPVSKLFEYTCGGSLSNPVWRPKVLGGSNPPAAAAATKPPPKPAAPQNAANRKRP